MSKCEPPSETWFELVFGIKETLLDIHHAIDVEEQPGKVAMRCDASRRTYHFGPLEVLNCSSFLTQSSRGAAHFQILDGPSYRASALDFSDFLVLQSLPQNKGSTFQVLSAFNCLPFIGPDQTAASGIASAIYDKTQGSRAAIASSPAFLYRNYFVPHEDDSMGQIGKEIELLCDTPLKIRHGFVTLTHNDERQLKSAQFDWSDLNAYRIGLQRKCPITLTAQDGFLTVLDSKHFVHQVFMGTLNFSGMAVKTEFTRNLARVILTAGYRATLLAAWENSILFPSAEGADRCFLAMAANDATQIPVEVMCQAIADCEDVIMNCGLEVVLVCEGKVDLVARKLGSLLANTRGEILTAEDPRVEQINM
jgi:hypothetical protein